MIKLQILSEAVFDEWSEKCPDRLLAIIRLGMLRPSDLTFALEAVGNINNEQAHSLLIKYLTHQSALVREGAVYGLSKMLNYKLKRILEKVAFCDPSPGVRQAAVEALT